MEWGKEREKETERGRGRDRERERERDREEERFNTPLLNHCRTFSHAYTSQTYTTFKFPTHTHTLTFSTALPVAL